MCFYVSSAGEVRTSGNTSGSLWCLKQDVKMMLLDVAVTQQW